LENSEESKSHEYETDEGSDEEDVFWGGPAEDEEPGGEEDGAEHHGGETGFGDGFVVILLELAGVEFVVACGG